MFRSNSIGLLFGTLLLCAQSHAKDALPMLDTKLQFGSDRINLNTYEGNSQLKSEVRDIPADAGWVKQRLPRWDLNGKSYSQDNHLVGPFTLSLSGENSDCPFIVSLSENDTASFTVRISAKLNDQSLWKKKYLSASENSLSKVLCAPNGQYALVFENAVSGDTERFNILKVDVNGTVTKLSGNPSAYAFPTPAQDSILIEGPVFENAGRIARSMQLVNAKSKAQKFYISTGSMEPLAWSKDGNKLLFLEFIDQTKIVKAAIKR